MHNDDDEDRHGGRDGDRGGPDDGHHGGDHGPGHENPGGGNPGPGGPASFEVEVVYNGVPKTFDVRRDDTVKSLLDRAIAAFGSLPQPHVLSLYNAAGAELSDSSTIGAAGVRPHDTLLLRPSTVKGG